MDESEEKKHDTRQLEYYGSRHRHIPGESRLHHLDGHPEQYVLSAWHVHVGDTVRARQVIATIETDSFILEFEAFDSGVLAEQCFAIGDIIPDRAIVARISLPTENTKQ